MNTSQAAAEANAPNAANQRERVLNAIITAGGAGLTDDEIQTKLEMPGNTQRPRRKELEQAARIEPAGTRLNTRGNRCRVWVAA